MLYENALIPPGQAVTKVKLKNSLKREVYTITLCVSNFDLIEYQKSLNRGEIQPKLIAIEKSME